MMWDRAPATGDLSAVLPLVVVMLAGLVPSRHEPNSIFLANQRWRYRDLILVLGVITVSEFVSLPGVSNVTEMWRWAIDSGSAALLIIVSVWGVVRWKHRRPWRVLGLDPATALDNTLWSLRIGLGVGSVFTLLVLVMRLASADVHFAPPAPYRMVWQGQLGGFLAALVVTTVLGPVTEELFFRGVAYGPMLRKFGAAGATVGSAALWAAAHYSGLSYASIGTMSVALVLGLVYAEIYRRRESLVPTVTFHIVQNATAFFVRDRYLVTLVPLAVVLVGLWIISIVLFHVVSRSRMSAKDGPSAESREAVSGASSVQQGGPSDLRGSRDLHEGR